MHPHLLQCTFSNDCREEVKNCCDLHFGYKRGVYQVFANAFHQVMMCLNPLKALQKNDVAHSQR